VFDYPKSATENLLSFTELKQHFIDFSTRTIGSSEAKDLMDKILKIEEIVNINRLFIK